MDIYVGIMLLLILEKNCGVPPARHYTSSITHNGTHYQDIATYTCLPGYNPDQSFTIQCQSNGAWATPSYCIGKCWVFFSGQNAVQLLGWYVSA